MFKRNILSVIAGSLVLLIPTAFASSAGTPKGAPKGTRPAVETSQPASGEAAQTPSTLSDAEMEALIQQKLQGSPHVLPFILGQKRTGDEWSKLLDRMIGYGAKINAQEKQLIIGWLVSR